MNNLNIANCNTLYIDARRYVLKSLDSIDFNKQFSVQISNYINIQIKC